MLCFRSFYNYLDEILGLIKTVHISPSILLLINVHSKLSHFERLAFIILLNLLISTSFLTPHPKKGEGWFQPLAQMIRFRREPCLAGIFSLLQLHKTFSSEPALKYLFLTVFLCIITNEPDPKRKVGGSNPPGNANLSGILLADSLWLLAKQPSAFVSRKSLSKGACGPASRTPLSEVRGAGPFPGPIWSF